MAVEKAMPSSTDRELHNATQFKSRVRHAVPSAIWNQTDSADVRRDARDSDGSSNQEIKNPAATLAES